VEFIPNQWEIFKYPPHPKVDPQGQTPSTSPETRKKPRSNTSPPNSGSQPHSGSATDPTQPAVGFEEPARGSQKHPAPHSGYPSGLPVDLHQNTVGTHTHLRHSSDTKPTTSKPTPQPTRTLAPVVIHDQDSGIPDDQPNSKTGSLHTPTQPPQWIPKTRQNTPPDQPATGGSSPTKAQAKQPTKATMTEQACQWNYPHPQQQAKQPQHGTQVDFFFFFFPPQCRTSGSHSVSQVDLTSGSQNPSGYFSSGSHPPVDFTTPHNPNPTRPRQSSGTPETTKDPTPDTTPNPSSPQRTTSPHQPNTVEYRSKHRNYQRTRPVGINPTTNPQATPTTVDPSDLTRQNQPTCDQDRQWRTTDNEQDQWIHSRPSWIYNPSQPQWRSSNPSQQWSRQWIPPEPSSPDNPPTQNK